jgi:hypothetical protein
MPSPARGHVREVQLIVSFIVALAAPLAQGMSLSEQFLNSLNTVSSAKSRQGPLGTVAAPSGRITQWFMSDGSGSKASGGAGRIILQPGGGGVGEPESSPAPAADGAEPPAGPVYTGGGQGGAPPMPNDPNAPMPNAGQPPPADVDPNAPFGDSPWDIPDETAPNPAPSSGGVPPAPGYPPAQSTPPYNVPAATGAPPIYAGMAYEVHAVGRDGRAVPVDPSTHMFRTGDRFVVHYRPSLPGRVDVFNINPRGVESAIDAANVAGGQLVTLGPYEFASTTGDESLRLVLTPCNSPALLAATRDIVKVPGGAAGPSALPLTACSAATRDVGVKTRDIRKAEVDGGTSYALDRVSRQEMITGQYAARQVTITFHHPY